MNPNGGTPTEPTQSATSTPVAAPVSNAPQVMDVLPPQPEPSAAPAPMAYEAASPASGTDATSAESGVVDAPPDDSPENILAEESQPPAPTEKPAKPAKKPKAAGNSSTAAIVATVVIVLALSAMAMFAYMQTNK